MEFLIVQFTQVLFSAGVSSSLTHPFFWALRASSLSFGELGMFWTFKRVCTWTQSVWSSAKSQAGIS